MRADVKRLKGEEGGAEERAEGARDMHLHRQLSEAFLMQSAQGQLLWARRG